MPAHHWARRFFRVTLAALVVTASLEELSPYDELFRVVVFLVCVGAAFLSEPFPLDTDDPQWLGEGNARPKRRAIYDHTLVKRAAIEEALRAREFTRPWGRSRS